jgi:hypothetical protein
VTNEDNIILIAVRNAYLANTKRLDETPLDYQLRRIFREYSKRFHTPLHLVYEMPLEEVLIDYWEALYEELEPKEIMQDMVRMVRDPEETKRLQENEDMMDADSHRFMMDEAQREAAVKKIDEVVKRFQSQIKPGLRPVPKDKDVELVQPALGKPPKVEERISMRFAAPGDVDEDMDALGLFDDPAPKK